MVSTFIKNSVARRICGDIVWSENPGDAMKKWRDIFGVSQSEVGRLMKVSPSVISDYEKGRRLPGAKFVKRFVEALMRLDGENGWNVTLQIAKTMNLHLEAIVDVCEFVEPMEIEDFVGVVEGEVLTTSTFNRRIYGYTILDSIKAIETLSGSEFFQIMGLTSERALVFTKVSKGRSPMVAVRVSLIKPAAVVVHGPRSVDELAVKLAEREKLPLILSRFKSEKRLIESLKRLCESFYKTDSHKSYNSKNRRVYR